MSEDNCLQACPCRERIEGIEDSIPSWLAIRAHSLWANMKGQFQDLIGPACKQEALLIPELKIRFGDILYYRL